MLCMSGQSILATVYITQGDIKMTTKAKFHLAFTVHMGTAYVMASLSHLYSSTVQWGSSLTSKTGEHRYPEEKVT